MRGLTNSIALAIQLAPSAAWGEPLYVSGLFSVLVDHLAKDKVDYNFCPSELGSFGLIDVRSYRPSSSWNTFCYLLGLP